MESITVEQLWNAGSRMTNYFTSEETRLLPYFQTEWHGIKIVNPKLRRYYTGQFVMLFHITDGRRFVVKLNNNHPIYDYVPGPFDSLSPVIDWGQLPVEFRNKDEHHMEVCIWC